MTRAAGALKVVALASVPLWAACQLWLDVGDGPAPRDVQDGGRLEASASDGGHGNVETVSGTYPGVTAVGLSKTTIYWSAADPEAGTAGAIWAMDRDGGSPIRLQSAAPSVPVDLVARFDGVVYSGGIAASCNRSFLRATTTGPVQTIVDITGCFRPQRIAGTATTLAAVGSRGTTATVIASEGTTPFDVIAQVGPRFDAVAVAPTGTIYVVHAKLSGAIEISRAEANAAIPLATVVERSVGDLESDGAYVYWATTSQNAVHRVGADGGAATVYPLDVVPKRIAVWKGAIFVAGSTGSTGRILRIDDLGTHGIVAVDGQPFDIAVDDTLVVWSNQEKMTIEMVHRQ